MNRTATCCCTKISITVEGDPVLNGICSCDNCKRRTGSAFGWSAYFDQSQILKRGGTPGIYHVAVSGPQQRYFCTECGSTVYWVTAAFPGMMGVAGGGFTDAPLPEPSGSYNDGGRCAWVTLPSEWVIGE